MKRKRSQTSCSASSSSRSGSSDVDDSTGHFSGGRGSVIDNRYVVREEIGLGTFGKVFRCLDQKYDEFVAVKVVRGIKKYVESAMIEARILNDIFDEQKRRNFNGCVKIYSHFKFDGHYCMVTERLGISLYDLLKKREHRGLPIDLVRSVARQLLAALEFLHSMRLIHTDLKVENILFVDRELLYDGEGVPLPRNPQIKLIDFGGATYDDEHKTQIICTRQYRGPEVILGLGWSYPADVWSAGCIIAEIYSGELFFATHENVEHLALMEAALGSSFPAWMCRAADDEFRNVFDRKGRVKFEELLSRDSIKFVKKALKLRDFFYADKESGIVELVRGLLEIDPHDRVSARSSSFNSFFHFKSAN